jgi:phage anti-repressor protein
MNTQTLIPVFSGKIADETIQLVNARDLHKFLESGKDFSSWMKERIQQYGFAENQDFISFSEFSEKPKDDFAHQNRGAKIGSGGHNKIEYHITLDMAKELSMVERNAKGKEARRYFIDCEKRLHDMNATPALKATAPMDLPIDAAPNKLALLKEIRSLSRELCHGAKNPLHRTHVGKALCELNELAGFADDLNPLVLLEMAKGLPIEAVDSHAVVQFWDNVNLIIDSGLALNHAHNPQHIAINMPYFRQLCDELGLPLADKTTLAADLKISKRFVGFNLSMTSKITKKSCRCWVFSQKADSVGGAK